MEKEVSHAAELGATLIVLGCVIGFVFYTVIVGTMVKEDGYSFANKIQVSTSENYLEDMVGQENIMPTATAYNILKTYGVLVPQYTCTVPTCTLSGDVLDLATDQVCLATHLTGKVSLEVTKLGEGEYSVVVADYVD